MSRATPLVRHLFKHLVSAQLLSAPRRSSRFICHLALSSSSSATLHGVRLAPASVKLQWRPLSNSVAAFSSTSASATSGETPSVGKASGVPPCTSVLIRCRKDVAEMLSESLLNFGASSVSMDDYENYERSDEVSICSIFADSADVSTSIARAANSIGIEESPSFEILQFNPYDWIKRTQESFDPVKVTDGLWIVPEWKAAPDPEATNIILNPGLAFGTGEHATTKLCLSLLHETVKGGEHFLDYGTGSGILSIAALKLGAAMSTGVDIDPQAITACYQNAILNNIGPEELKLHLILDDDASSTSSSHEWKHTDVRVHKFVNEGALPGKNQFDIVIANILLNPLLDLAEEIVSHAKDGAVIGLSGIILDQVPRVIERYSRLLDDISMSQMEDWACIIGRKKAHILVD